jgi:uncharacterized protein
MMQDIPMYKVIHCEDSVILFFPQSLDIISMAPGDFEVTKEEQIVECYENFMRKYRERMQGTANETTRKAILSKIMLNLTDNCNLDCTYCYASKYYNEQDMSEETIEKIISKFFLTDFISVVKRVVFFGGEPLLNLRGMEYLIKRMEVLFAENKIMEIPRFNIITNGTIYNDRIAHLFKKYNMGIIVSCDGPPDLQNMHRPFRGSGKGSFKIVAENIKQMVKDGLKPGIECTVTNHTVASQYNHAGLKEFFQKEFGLDSIFFVQENMTAPEKIFDYSDFQKQGNIYFQILMGFDHDTDTFEVPYRLLTRKPLGYACGLGKASFHILANGDVYPCQLVAGMDEFKITDINTFNDSIFLTNTWTQKYEKQSAKCHACWAKPICKFCPARQILESGCYTLTENDCNHQRELLQDLIIKVVKLRKDPQQWEDFTSRLKAKANTIEEKLETLSVIN